MKSDEYLEQFSKIFRSVEESNWSDKIDKTKVSLAILREISKDRRMNAMRKTKAKAKREPATEKQKKYMEDLDIVYGENITKEEASREIERALEEDSGNRD